MVDLGEADRERQERVRKFRAAVVAERLRRARDSSVAANGSIAHQIARVWAWRPRRMRNRIALAVLFGVVTYLGVQYIPRLV